ncbi:MAG: nuclear transport factor 2 family protein [Hyphomonadaceae bacterium]|nr:nuclear transport factor 2 family protein [Hyphomonadaceae bacterium]
MMQNLFRAMLVVVSLMLAPAAAIAQNTHASAAVMSPETLEAAKAVDAFHAALSTGDGGGAAAMLVDDALIFESGRAERSRAEYASHHAGADAAYAAAVPSKLTQRTGYVEGGTAWIVSESRATGKYQDKPVDRVTTETMILRKTAEGWRIAHIHWSSRAAK